METETIVNLICTRCGAGCHGTLEDMLAIADQDHGHWREESVVVVCEKCYDEAMSILEQMRQNSSAQEYD